MFKSVTKSCDNIVKISSKGYHCLAINTQGNVYSWGSNEYGNLGDGTFIDSYTPILINLSNIVQVATGVVHSIALTNEGKVYTWGHGIYGQLGDGEAKIKNIPEQVPVLCKIKEISAGAFHSLALDEDGVVHCWGNNEFGQLGTETKSKREQYPIIISSLPKIKKISAGGRYSMALSEDGHVYCWGSNIYSQLANSLTECNKPIIVPYLPLIKEISAGRSYSMALSEEGNVYVWGLLNKNETISVPTLMSLPFIKDISAGRTHFMALSESGYVYVWGSNKYGKLGLCCFDEENPTCILDLPEVQQVISGGDHSLVLTKEGQIYTWGRNNSGQLGNGTNRNNRIPTVIKDFSSGWLKNIIRYVQTFYYSLVQD